MAKNSAGFSTPEVAHAAGLSVRQVAYWTVARLVVPAVADPAGTGNHRRYSLPDVLAFSVLGAMREHGVSLQSLRVVQRYLRSQKGAQLQDLHARLVWAPGNKRYSRDVALIHSDSEIVSLLTEPGQRIAPVVVNVGELYQQVRERIEGIRSTRKAKVTEQTKQRAEAKRGTDVQRRRISERAA